MSVGLMCECSLPPMRGLTLSDEGHGPQPDGKRGCPNYAEDQEHGGLCRFCADAHVLRDRMTHRIGSRPDTCEWCRDFL